MLCYVCNCMVATLDELHKHLSRHRVLGELRLPMKCSQGDCKSSFNRFSNLLRHLRTYHSSDDFVDPDVVSSEIQCASPHEDNDCVEKPLFSDEARCSLRDIRAEGEVMMATLRTNIVCHTASFQL